MLHRPTRAVGAVLSCVAVVALMLAPPASAVLFTPGSAGVGDPYFPGLGNGGFDIAHYDLDLAYNPARHYLSGTATIAAQATQNLSRFDLDLSGMNVRTITVDQVPARFRRAGAELVITPGDGLRSGSNFTIVVHYDGSPQTITGSPIVFGADYGWQYTPDGAFVGDEPNAAHTWFPSNDHPSDKATYTFDITVPQGTQVVANGQLVEHTTTRTGTTFVWDETNPMATYLATVDIGSWRFQRGSSPHGIPELMAYDPDLASDVASRNVFELTGRVTDYWGRTFGSYPFTSTGAIVDNLPNVGFSLETQTRPLYGFAPDKFTLSHELSHQWFGDSVSVRTWRDIWLNEGFATFAEWLWSYEHTGKLSTSYVAKYFYDHTPAKSKFWDQSIADPQRNTMFSAAVYYRGGMTLAALRDRIGDDDFFTLLQRWTAAHKYGNAQTSQFIALAEQVSGQNLDNFFRIWLYDKAKPSSFDAG